MPTAENLFLLVISMLALESFRSIRFAWKHIFKLTDKSLNSFYYTLGYAAFDHLRWMAVTARLALGCMPPSLKGFAVFLSIDDTMVEKYGMKFQACLKLSDHSAHNGSNYLNGHCFVSIMLHVPVESEDGGIYLSVPLGYRLWTKELSKLELAADTVLYDLPGERTGKRGRPRTHGGRLELSAIGLDRPEGAPYYMGCRKVIINLWKGRTVYACVTAADPEKPGSFRLFLCTAEPEGIAVEPAKQADEKIRSYSTWGMLPLGLFSLRWNIETGYYETKTF